MSSFDPLQTDVRLSEASEIAVGQRGDTWELLAGYLESFISEWDASERPPTLAEFLPKQAGALRRFVMVELIKVDLEYRQNGAHSTLRLQQYAETFPELAGSGMPTDLIFEEFHARRRGGETVEAEEYLAAYPAQASELRGLLGVDIAATTSMHQSMRSELAAGESVDDFELILPLGKGAFGSVYLAKQLSMQRLVALKVTNDEGLEPQTLAQLDHPGIVRVYDQRRHGDTNLRLLYMQYLPGGTLQEVIKRVNATAPEQRSGRLAAEAVRASIETGAGLVTFDPAVEQNFGELSWAELVCRWGAALADALDYAHSKDVLHRDLKPANILLGADGMPKLADFNISFGAGVEGATAQAFFGGSLAYMSPEQLEAFDPKHERRPDELDGRSDIYSLAIMLWELLHGARPFKDLVSEGGWGTTLAAMQATRKEGVEETPPPEEEMAARLLGVLRKCLAGNPDDRFACGAELAAALRLCQRPHAARLLETPNSGWRRWALTLPVVAVLLAELLPNALAAVFNYVYNKQEIIDRVPDAARVFENVQVVINSIAFPVGLVTLAALAWSVTRYIARGKSTGALESEPRKQLRRRALRLGHLGALVGIFAWAIAGIVYPMSMHAATGAFSAVHYVHFFASLLLCGLIAASYPFFLITLLSLRVIYPALLRGEKPNHGDSALLAKLGRTSGIYLFIAGGVPALSVVALVVTSMFTDSESKMALVVLSLAGALGFAVAFALYRAIQRDVEALGEVATRVGEGPSR